MIGSNTTEAHPVLALRIKKAVRKGATLVVADPRKIWLTKLAKRHLQLRPGTDVWLLNAMMHTILEEGLQNEEYIREVTDDFEAVREIVMRYSPEDAEKITGVPAEDIRATAREYASEKHAGIFYTLGITEHACGVDNIWSLSNLVLMTGHLGYESTGLNALRGQNNVQGLNDSGANPSYLPGYQPVDDPEIRRKFAEAWGAPVPERPGYRLDQIVSGLHDGRIKALYLIGENPAQTEPNAKHVEEGLEGLEFMMSQDIFLNDSTRKYAHVVLPASSFAEKDGTFTNTERRISRVRAAAPLPGEARVDREIVIAMAKALGANWPEYPDAESVWNELADLSPNWYGIRYDRIEENGMQWPCTDLDHPGTPYLHAPRPALPTGRGRFFPVEFQPPIEEPDSEYPFVLTTGRTLYHYNSANMTMREPGVTDKQQAPFFEIHAEDAGALGIADRQVARLVSRRGALEAEAHYSERVYPGARLDVAPLRGAEGELADARRRRSAHRNARVQGQRRSRRDARVTASSANRASTSTSCESTQLLVDTSLPEGALVVADHQSAGRGRLGRSWEAPAGAALLFSVLLKPPPERPAPELALVAGIAVADALERTLGLSVQIKWPNDVMLRRKKVAGCLAEARDGAVVLGIGVNVEQTNDELPPNAGSIRTLTGRGWDRDDLLSTVLEDLGNRYAVMACGRPRRRLRRARPA